MQLLYLPLISWNGLQGNQSRQPSGGVESHDWGSHANLITPLGVSSLFALRGVLILTGYIFRNRSTAGVALSSWTLISSRPLAAQSFTGMLVCPSVFFTFIFFFSPSWCFNFLCMRVHASMLLCSNFWQRKRYSAYFASDNEQALCQTLFPVFNCVSGVAVEPQQRYRFASFTCFRFLCRILLGFFFWASCFARCSLLDNLSFFSILNGGWCMVSVVQNHIEVLDESHLLFWTVFVYGTHAPVMAWGYLMTGARYNDHKVLLLNQKHCKILLFPWCHRDIVCTEKNQNFV